MHKIGLEVLIREIQRKYSGSYPNGIMDSWDLERYSQHFAQLFSNYEVLNQTDFNYSYCNSYDVILGAGKETTSNILTIKASFIYDAYSLHITRYSEKLNGKVIPLDLCSEFKNEVDTVRIFFESRGFREIQADEMDVEINGIELELSEVATVGKCLFDDFE